MKAAGRENCSAARNVTCRCGLEETTSSRSSGTIPERHLPFPTLTLLFRDAFVDTNTSFRSVKRFFCAALIPAYLGFPRTRAQRRLNGPGRISGVAVGVVGMLYSCEMCFWNSWRLCDTVVCLFERHIVDRTNNEVQNFGIVILE